MILLDTDHLTVLGFPEHSAFATLSARMATAADQTFGATVVSAEEHMRGWLARINRLRDVHDQIAAYQELAELFAFFQKFPIISFDRAAADEFKRLRKQKIRIGTMDLKIGAIALTRGALLLSANKSDFGRIPGLRVENWLIEPSTHT